MAGGHINLSFVQEPEEAIESLHAASRILETLVTEGQSLPTYKHYWALTHVALGTHLAKTESGDAEASYQHARTLLEESTRDHPEEPDYRCYLGRALSGLARVAVGRSDLEQAREHVEHAIGCQTEH